MQNKTELKDEQEIGEQEFEAADEASAKPLQEYSAESDARQMVSEGGKPPGDLLQAILAVAANPAIDLDRADRLFEMHEQMMEGAREQKFNADMAKAQSEIQSAIANRDNDFLKSNFADLEAIHKAAKPHWTKHGFSVLTRETASESSGCIKVITEIRHRDGHKETLSSDWPLDAAGSQGNKNKTPIQAKGSTISYARRYNELMAFDVSVAHDSDGNAPPKEEERLSAEQVAIVQAEMDKAGVDAKYVCKKAQVASLKFIHPARFDGLLSHLQQLASKRAGGAKT